MGFPLWKAIQQGFLLLLDGPTVIDYNFQRWSQQAWNISITSKYPILMYVTVMTTLLNNWDRQATFKNRALIHFLLSNCNQVRTRFQNKQIRNSKWRFYQFSRFPTPFTFLFIFGCWANLLHSKSQQGIWEAMKTQAFLRASRPPNMDNCQSLLVAVQKNEHSGGLAKHPIIFKGLVSMWKSPQKYYYLL